MLRDQTRRKIVTALRRIAQHLGEGDCTLKEGDSTLEKGTALWRRELHFGEGNCTLEKGTTMLLSLSKRFLNRLNHTIHLGD